MSEYNNSEFRGTSTYEKKTAINEIINFVPFRPLLQLTPANWKPIVYTALILAIKYLEDRRYWNKDIVDNTMLFDIKDTNNFEHLFLNIIDFNLHIE
jgi:hypothetical protein